MLLRRNLVCRPEAPLQSLMEFTSPVTQLIVHYGRHGEREGWAERRSGVH